MTASAARIVFIAGLLLLAAMAAIPLPRIETTTATLVASPASTESKLAGAISTRIAMETTAGTRDQRIDQLSNEIAGLRRVAFEDDAESARGELIDALADELSAAMARRSLLAQRDGADAEGVRAADALIRGLTAAINAEVRGLST